MRKKIRQKAGLLGWHEEMLHNYCTLRRVGFEPVNIAPLNHYPEMEPTFTEELFPQHYIGKTEEASEIRNYWSVRNFGCI